MEQAKTIILSFIIAFTSPVMADCPNNVEPIHQGDKAVCDGFLFSDPAEKQAEQDRSDATYYKVLSDKLQQKSDLEANENEVLEKRLKLYMDESQSLSQDVAKRDSNETWIHFGYFVLGILATGLAVRNIRP